MPNHVPDQAEGLRKLIEAGGSSEGGDQTSIAIEEMDSAPEEVIQALTPADELPTEEETDHEEPVVANIPAIEPEFQRPSAVITVSPPAPKPEPLPRGRERLPVCSQTKVIAVTSGKGGVGKTNLVCNIALALAQMGRRVAVFDADLSLANIDVLLGISPRYNLSHVISGEKTLKEILVTGPEGILIVPGGSGIEELANLETDELECLLDSFAELDGECDVLLLDTAAGISHSVLSFLIAADQVLVITTPEPTAYTDAYAVIKVLTQHAPDKRVGVAVNMARNHREGGDVIRLMLQICRTMLRVGFDNMGSIPRDLDMLQAVRDQRPLLLHSPYSPAAKQIRRLACALVQTGQQGRTSGGIRGFMNRLLGRVRAPAA